MAIINGTPGNNILTMTNGVDTVSGGAGDDDIVAKGFLTGVDTVDGGGDWDDLILDGDYSAGVAFGAQTIKNVELLRLTSGHAYAITMHDGNLAAGQHLYIEYAGLNAADRIVFNGAAETNASFAVER